MRKRILFLLVLLTVLPLANTAAMADGSAPGVSASAAVLLHPESGEALFERNADSPMLVASTTKLMTALVVLERCDPGEKVTVLPEHTTVEGSSMYLSAGGDYTVEDLLYGLLLASGNDAALALASHVAGDVEGFAELMNEKAARLELTGSSFKNPHGLDEDGHYSCARDLALIMAAAMEIPLFLEISGSRSHTVGGCVFYNHNRLLGSCEGVLAGKTGYTMAAGRALVTCCERDGMRLVCVTLSAPDDWDDHAALYDWAYAEYTDESPLPDGCFARVEVVSGVEDAVEVASRELRLLRRKDAKVELRCELPAFVHAPVKENGRAGTVTVYLDGEPAGEAELYYVYGVPIDGGVPLMPLELARRAFRGLTRCCGFYYDGCV